MVLAGLGFRPVWGFATLGSFTGDGFGRFGLESCWGFPVSLGRHARNVRAVVTRDGWLGRFEAWILLRFPCFGRMPHRACDEELASAWGLNPRVLRALILVVASSFVCGCIASSFCFFRPSERNVRQFYGGWFWQVWAWILLGFPCFGCMPHRALWRGIGFRLRLESSRSSGLDLGGCIIFCLRLHCIIFLFL